MTVKELASSLNLTPIALPDESRSVSGVYIGDLLSWVMGHAKNGEVWITIMSNMNTVAVASLTHVACILLAEGETVSAEIRRVAEEKGVNILSSKETAYRLAVKIAALVSPVFQGEPE